MLCEGLASTRIFTEYASPTHAILFAGYEQGWIGDPARYGNGASYYGINKPVGEGAGGSLFFTHYSILGLDSRAFTDRFGNYFDNNRRTILINRAYCVVNPSWLVPVVQRTAPKPLGIVRQAAAAVAGADDATGFALV